jgi:hypothetical protein
MPHHGGGTRLHLHCVPEALKPEQPVASVDLSVGPDTIALGKPIAGIARVGSAMSGFSGPSRRFARRIRHVRSWRSIDELIAAAILDVAVPMSVAQFAAKAGLDEPTPLVSIQRLAQCSA